MNLGIVFLTGLTVGGLSCLAVQGGLLASVIASRKGEEKTSVIWSTGAFLVSKLISYTILGFLLGGLGGTLNISSNVQTLMQLAAGFYMLAIGLNLLEVHPIFRYAVIQPPKFLTRLVKNQSRSKNLFAPAFLGVMTIFIPCGTTLAMEALAISSSSALLGAFTMAVFTLGTMPIFLGIGFLTATFSKMQGQLLKLAALAVLYLGVTSVNGSLVAFGSPVTIQSLGNLIPIEISLGGQTQPPQLVNEIEGVQVADIKVFPNGYYPSKIQVKSGERVKLNLTPVGSLGCTNVFKIPKLGITQSLVMGKTSTVEFTPQSKGKLTWTCSMGMYTGELEVL